MRSPLKLILGVVGIVLALGWSLQGVDFNEVLSVLSEMDGTLTVVVLGLTSLNLIVRAFVWKYVVSPLKPVPIKNAISSYLIGVFSNLFLPFKLGDVAQGYSLGRKQQMSKITLVSAVIIQRVFEICSLFFIMVFVGVMFSFPILFAGRALFLAFVILSVISLIVAIYFNKRKIIGFVEKILILLFPKLAQGAIGAFKLFLDGVTAIRNVTDVIRIFALSLLSWFIQILMVKFTADAMNIDIDIVASSVVLLLINMGLIIPLVPGNIGTFQFFSILALSMFSVGKSRSLAFALIFQVIQGVPVIIGGGISLFQEFIQSKRGEPLLGKKK